MAPDAREVICDRVIHEIRPACVSATQLERDGRSGRSGEPRAISQRLQFIFLKETGPAVDGGPAPYLDCRPITAEERALIADAVTAPWLSGQVESRALGYAVQSLVPQHLDEVKTRRIVEIDKVERERASTASESLELRIGSIGCTSSRMMSRCRSAATSP